MSNFTKSQTNQIKDAMSFPNSLGYVLDFSDKTFTYYFEEEFGVDIDDEIYHKNGSSKANRLISYLQSVEKSTALRVLRTLWERREALLEESSDLNAIDKAKEHTDRFRKLITDAGDKSEIIQSDGVEKFSSEITLEELVNDIRRTLDAGKPEVAIDRLHTYCMKKIKHLLKIRDITYKEKDTLDALFSRYRNELVQDKKLSKFSDKALKSSIDLLKEFNYLRNNKSLAHDKKILNNSEAQYIFSTVNSTLVLIRALELNKYNDL